MVEDCGTIINPQLVDEQIRGGVVQGLGAALFEKCIYDERGQLTNANMADYLVPMSGEMPDIDVGHVVSPTAETELGAKGAGEAGTAGAAAAVANAVNDALRPFGAMITEIPLTPQVILTALGTNLTKDEPRKTEYNEANNIKSKGRTANVQEGLQIRIDFPPPSAGHGRRRRSAVASGWARTRCALNSRRSRSA